MGLKNLNNFTYSYLTLLPNQYQQKQKDLTSSTRHSKQADDVSKAQKMDKEEGRLGPKFPLVPNVCSSRQSPRPKAFHLRGSNFDAVFRADGTTFTD